MHEVVRFHQLPPLWYTRQMHDDLSFDHVGLGAAAALRTLIDQRDARGCYLRGPSPAGFDSYTLRK